MEIMGKETVNDVQEGQEENNTNPDAPNSGMFIKFALNLLIQIQIHFFALQSNQLIQRKP
jgi:hypothetical protein